MELDSAIEKQQFDEAVALSDKLSQRKFAKQVTTAFSCHEYVRQTKVWILVKVLVLHLGILLHFVYD